MTLLLLWTVSRCQAAGGPIIWNGMTLQQLAAQYNCAWMQEQRKIYSDDELRQKAKELGLPRAIIRMAERCPK